MKRIYKGILYDTDASELIHFDAAAKRKLYKTENGNFFVLYNNSEIYPKTEESTKEYLGEKDVDKYIELWGNPEPQSDFNLLLNETVAKLEEDCRNTVFAGVDVTLSTGTEHFSLNYEDQINLTALASKMSQAASQIEWHPDDQDVQCKYYSVEDMTKIINALMNHKTYHITYLRDLRIYVKTFTKESDLRNVYYGMEIPEEYKSEVLKNYESIM